MHRAISFGAISIAPYAGYDVFGRIVVETAIDHPTGCTHTLAHAHDPLCNRIRTTLPELPGSPARNLHYLYYGSGHLHHVRLSLDQGEGGQRQSCWPVERHSSWPVGRG